MRAFAINEFGDPGRVQELPDPQPGEGEVLIRVHAASVNRFDVSVANGATRAYPTETRLPLVPGLDASGTIAAIGPHATGFKLGDEVVAIAVKPYWGGGTFAELVTVPASAVTQKPAMMEHTAAATIAHTGLTALGAVDALAPSAEQVIVVLGATGGVGSWFTQLAALGGATVVALARPENAAYAKSLGPTEVLDYTAGDVIEQLRAHFPDGIDGLADFSGNTQMVERLAALVRTGGRVSSSAIKLDADAYAARGIRAMQANRVDPRRLPDLVRLIRAGRIKPPAAQVVPLDDAAAALAQVDSGHTRGKIVLAISD